jgi:hypothetical protein
MPTPVREQLLSAITTAVGGTYGVPLSEDERDLPLIIVQDGEEVAEPTAYGATEYTIEVSVISVDKAADRVAGQSQEQYQAAMRAKCHELLAASQVLFFADPTFGGLADGVDYTGGSITAEANGLCYAAAQFSVRYHTVRGDPFTID